jgi:hypothetical protein
MAALQTMALPVLLVLALALIVLLGPLLLSDGPSHVGMASFMLHAHDPAWPLQARVYELNPRVSPNFGGDLILAGLMKLLPPLAAEQALQAICVLSLPLAGLAVLRRISPAAGVLAVFFIPLAFQRLFFLGLYNFSLSMTGCLLAIWGYLFLRTRFSLARGMPLALILVATLACHPAGWMEAVIAVGTMAAADGAIQLKRTGGIAHALRDIVTVAAAAFSSLVLFAYFLISGTGKSQIIYGAGPVSRLLAIAKGAPFGSIGRGPTIAGIVLPLILLALAIRQAMKLRRDWPGLSSDRQGLALGLLALPIAFICFVLIIPDTAGGGWTHVWRAEAFPYLGLVLAAAPLAEGPRIRLAALGAAIAASLVVLWSVLMLQTVYAPATIAEFQEADALIGPHCAVAPVVFNYKLDLANTAQLANHPLFHLATRLELKDDRAVLFNYNARLPIYPVRYRLGVDPHQLLYHWAPGESDTRIYQIDVANFERRTGIPIDYVLVWGPPGPDQLAFWRSLHETALQDFRLVHRSRGGRLELYQRRLPGGCAKPAR